MIGYYGYSIPWHEALTRLAIERLRNRGYKISEDQEERLVRANAWTDIYQSKRLLPEKAKAWHALKDYQDERRQVVRWLLDKAMKSKDPDEVLDAVGILTHVTQDIYSHERLGLTSRNAIPFHFYPWKSIDPDNPLAHPEHARKAVKATERVIKTVIDKRGLPEPKGGKITIIPSRDSLKASSLSVKLAALIVAGVHLH